MTRQINTVEELDALPIGSVVLSHWYPNGPEPAETKASFQKRPDGEWYRGARASWVHPDGFLPATILYEPNRETRTPFDADCGTCGDEISDRLKAQGEWVKAISFPMYLCPDCGNKRCPKAADCGQRCEIEVQKEKAAYEQLANDPERPRRPGPRPLPDRDEIARAILDVHNRLGRSDYNGLPRETSLDAADAVLELLRGETG